MAVYKISSTVSTCVSPCPNTTITTINPTSLYYSCESCNGDCLTCSISITFCLSCKAGFVLNNNTCVLTCPPNKFLINGACRDCA
jgi:proprotein convertase subtilisin/kexin type 5